MQNFRKQRRAGAQRNQMGFLWGMANALNFSGLMVEDIDLRGLEADAEALAGDWRVAVNHANEAVGATEERKSR